MIFTYSTSATRRIQDLYKSWSDSPDDSDDWSEVRINPPVENNISVPKSIQDDKDWEFYNDDEWEKAAPHRSAPSNPEKPHHIGPIPAPHRSVSGSNVEINQETTISMSGSKPPELRDPLFFNDSVQKTEDQKAAPHSSSNNYKTNTYVVREFGDRSKNKKGEINIPKGSAQAVLGILTEESRNDICPFDLLDLRNSKSQRIIFSDSKRKRGKFKLTQAYEMLLVMLSKIFWRMLRSEKENGWYEIPGITFKKLDDRYSFFLTWLEKHGFIEINNSYLVGKFSKGYRYKNVNDIEVFYVTEPTVLKKMSKPMKTFEFDPALQQMADLLKKKVSTATLKPGVHEWVDEQNYAPIDSKKEKMKLDKIGDPSQYNFFRKAPGRIYSIFHNLPRDIRKKYLQLNGEDIQELDIRCSQPSILFSIYDAWKTYEDDLEHFRGYDLMSLQNQKQVEIERLRYHFTTNDKNKDFYSFLADQYEAINGEVMSRDGMKTMVFGFLFSKSYQVNKKMEKIFRIHFPVLFDFIHKKLASENKPLWFELQRRESEIVIDQVAVEIAKLDFDFITVHDSIGFPSSKYDIVYPIWKRILNENGVPNQLN